MGFIVNAMVETKYGPHFITSQNTMDPLDLVYGTVSAGYAGAVGPNIEANKSEEYWNKYLPEGS